MNGGAYHEAGVKVLNWRKLSVGMQARYGKWKIACDCSWTAYFAVEVTHHNGRLLKVAYRYPFEHEVDAKACLKWWEDNGCLAALETL